MAMTDQKPLTADELTSCPLEAVNMFDPEFLQEPYPFYARLRKEAPVFRDAMGVVHVSTYNLIQEVNSKPKIFSNMFAEQLRSGSAQAMDPDEMAILMEGYPVVDTMLTADPPRQTRYRKMAMKAFSYKRVLQMGEYVTEVANALIDGFIDKGGCEFKSEFADLLPMTVIADQLGAPREDMDRFAKWSDAFIIQLGGISDKETRLQAARDIVEFQKYFVDVIERKRANPTEDLISDLVHATYEEDGEEKHMEYNELLSMIQQILVAGNETTAHSLTAGLFYLISNPAEFEKLLANPDLTPNFVEETLRILTPSNNMWRVAKEDAEVGGVPIKKNDLLLVRYGSANRDETKFENPDAFDIERENAKEHLAFGVGIHTCIGAQLARKEMATAFPIIFERMKNIRFAEGVNTFRYTPNVLLRGVLQLHLEFDKA